MESLATVGLALSFPVNIGEPKNMAKAQAQGLFETKCPALVKSAAEIL
jgi:hypothetical protein